MVAAHRLPLMRSQVAHRSQAPRPKVLHSCGAACAGGTGSRDESVIPAWHLPLWAPSVLGVAIKHRRPPSSSSSSSARSELGRCVVVACREELSGRWTCPSRAAIIRGASPVIATSCRPPERCIASSATLEPAMVSEFIVAVGGDSLADGMAAASATSASTSR